ncbi:MAG: glycine cleavage system protein [Myxococcales bacterium]|nr:glycine cleavage system protein [Myxococcales bacterium]
MKQTPLYGRHQALGAKVIDFGGWAMPVQYSGILDEHRAVRESAGIFDVSHMGEVWFRGPRAAEAVQRLVTNDVGKLADGGAMYSCACRPSGGIVDDLIVYRAAADDFLIVVNASNIDKDFGWFRDQTGSLCEIVNLSDETGLLAVQGPRAVALVQSISDRPVAELRAFTYREALVGGVKTQVARTGYTGEDGFELFAPANEVAKLWDAVLDAGAGDCKPIGLGARDTLRLEARLSLYGNDIDEEHTPHEAGLTWVVKGKGFLGEEALAKQKAEGLKRKLVGFVMKERGTARHGYNIVGEDGAAIGVVTSGSLGPTVGVNIGLGYVPTALAQPGTRLQIDCRGKSAAAEVVSGPFYKRRS